MTLTLIVLSCHMLQLPPERTLYFAAAITVMTFTLTAMAVGLGVHYPNFKEENPSKIVSGFGGALCFVLSSIYIIASLTLLVVGGGGFHSDIDITIGCIAGFVLMSFVIGWLPMRWGLKCLDHFEP